MKAPRATKHRKQDGAVRPGYAKRLERRAVQREEGLREQQEALAKVYGDEAAA